MKRWLFVLLVSCRGCDEKPVSIETPVFQDVAMPDAAEATVQSKPLSDATRYDCAGIEPDPMTGPCTSPHVPSDDLILVNDDLSDIMADHFPATSPVWAPATRALAKAEGVDPTSLVPAERIALQNAALQLSRVAATTLEPALAARAEKLVKRLAFTPPVIAMDLEPWLGPKSAWTDRTVAIVPNVHEQFFSATRSLRIVRTPSIRANFARLIAIDPSGKPFVSDVVGSIEIRRGLDKSASVCVVVLDPARIRCKLHGGLRAVRSLTDLPHTPFAQHDASVAKCNSCHIEEESVVGLKLVDLPGFDSEHDRKLLEVLAKKP